MNEVEAHSTTHYSSLPLPNAAMTHLGLTVFFDVSHTCMLPHVHAQHHLPLSTPLEDNEEATLLLSEHVRQM